MIKLNDWRKFNEMHKILDDMAKASMLDDMNKHFNAIHKEQEEERKKALLHGGLVRIVFRPYYPMFITNAKYPKTVEGCMDWIVDGRPVFAKKLKVNEKNQENN